MTAPRPPDADPAALAGDVVRMAGPVLVGLDVDGVLAPIVDHADDARLLPGMLEAVEELAEVTPVAVVSGRRLADLHGFGFDEPIELFGTHGLERGGTAGAVLAPDEQRRYDRLRTVAEDAATLAGDGAWVELKALGVVLHVRQADPARAEVAVAEAMRLADDVTDAHVKQGKSVAELLVRATSKAAAIVTLRQEEGAAAVVFLGDDATDEEVFAALGPDDLGIRVGPGATAATARLADPDAVLTFLRTLARALAPG